MKYPVPNGGVSSSTSPGSVVSLGGGAQTSADSLGRTKVLNKPGGVGMRDVASPADAPWNVTPDAVGHGFSSVVNAVVQLTSYTPVASDVGKTICIPGAGSDDGFGVRDGFTTTIQSINVGLKQFTLTDSVTTNVTTGANLNAIVGTDWSTQLQALINAVGPAGVVAAIPPGNYLITTTLSIGTSVNNNHGHRFEGAGGGAGNSAGTSATAFWYVGPRNATQGNATGAGAPAVQVADSTPRWGVRISGFTIRCFRALCIHTTVSGAGQTINSSVHTLTVASAAGFPTAGRISIAGVTSTNGLTPEASYNGIVGNVLQNVQTDNTLTSGTATNGGIVRLVVPAFNFDNINQSEASDIVAVGYADNAFNTTNQNSGIGFALLNFTNGYNHFRRLHARYFGGANYGIRFGSCNTAYGSNSNSGNCTMDACTSFFCNGAFEFYATTGPVDGNVFNNLKAIVGGAISGGTGAGHTASGYLVTYGMRGNTWNSPHCESSFNPYRFDACTGNTMNAPWSQYQGASSGDGSMYMNFVNGAMGNVVNGGQWLGWTGGSPGAPTGTPGFAYVMQTDSTSVGNILSSSPDPAFNVIGTALTNISNSTNRWIDLSALPGGDAGSGQQAGVLAPEARNGPGGVVATVATANQAYFARFVPSRPMTITKIAYNVTTAATNDDAVDVGIYQVVGGSLVKVVTKGSINGKANGAGVQTISLAANLVPGQVYYAAFAYGTVGGTAATIQGKQFSVINNANLFGNTAGTAEIGIQSTAFPLPTSPTPNWASASAMYFLAVRES